MEIAKGDYSMQAMLNRLGYSFTIRKEEGEKFRYSVGIFGPSGAATLSASVHPELEEEEDDFEIFLAVLHSMFDKWEEEFTNPVEGDTIAGAGVLDTLAGGLSNIMVLANVLSGRSIVDRNGVEVLADPELYGHRIQ